MFWFQKLIKAIKDERAQNNGYESETKDVLKPICNDDCVVLGRSKAKNQNNAIVLTAILQSFGTRLRAVDLTIFNGIDRRPFEDWTASFVSLSKYYRTVYFKKSSLTKSGSG